MRITVRMATADPHPSEQLSAGSRIMETASTAAQNLPAFDNDRMILAQIQDVQREMREHRAETQEQIQDMQREIHEHRAETQEQIRVLRQDFRQDLHQMEVRLGRRILARKAKTNILNILVNLTVHSTVNSAARIINDNVRSADDPLRPLVNATTAAPIPGFPSTLAQLKGMTEEVMMEFLRALDVDDMGTCDEKRVRLIIAIGLPYYSE